MRASTPESDLTMNKLQRLHAEQGQSLWLDDLGRTDPNDGALARLVAVDVPAAGARLGRV
jgi:hypothetical protein